MGVRLFAGCVSVYVAKGCGGADLPEFEPRDSEVPSLP
jgi:hypothetical protein